MQYKCIKCSEPVSDNLPDNTLERGVIILCQSCLMAHMTMPFSFSVDLTDYPQLLNINANELESQFKEIENV